MRALHMPGVPKGQTPPYKFPDKPCPPEELQFSTDFPEPTIPADTSSHVYVVQVQATAVTKGELGWEELLDPKRFHPYGGTIPGRDLVGTIAQVHPVTSERTPKFQKGDQVWGFVHEDREGAAADRAIVLEHEICLVPARPAGASPEWIPSLATVPLSGLTAWQALFKHGRLSTEPQGSGERSRVLITGAAGSVGVPTVQIAKLFGFHVTAVCSSRHAPFLKGELGVDSIIDYTRPGFTTVPSSMRSEGLSAMDLVIDCVGGETGKAILLDPTCVKSGGKIILIAQPLESYGDQVKQQAESAGKQQGVDQEFFIVKMCSEQLHELGQLVADGRLVPHLDLVYPLEHGRDAVIKIEKKGAVGRGKVVIQVANDAERWRFAQPCPRRDSLVVSLTET